MTNYYVIALQGNISQTTFVLSKLASVHLTAFVQTFQQREWTVVLRHSTELIAHG